MSTPIILASSSPRRYELLSQIGIKFKVLSKEIDENISALSPIELVSQLSLKKALAVAEDLSEGIVIGADTVVTVDGEIYGKPHDRREAYLMLEKLSGRAHEVLSGISIVDAAGQRQSYQRVSITKVYFRKLDKREIEKYLDCGEYKDKAGAYGIQGKGAVLTEKIEGCFYNVVGLPIAEVVLGLGEMGVDIYE